MSDKLREIRLYGKLGARFGRRFHLAVSSAAEAVRALCVMLPGFEQYLMTSKDRNEGYAVFIGKQNIDEDGLTYPVGNEPIRIAPVTLGSKRGGVLQIVLGAALVVVGVLVTGLSYGWAAPVGNALIGMGVSMMVGGVMQLLSPQPKANKPKERPGDDPSYTFSGPVNTQAQGHPVPVLIGRMIVGSAVVSAGISVNESAYVPTVRAGGGGGGSTSYHSIWNAIEAQVQ